jgi:hypothetical protein
MRWTVFSPRAPFTPKIWVSDQRVHTQSRPNTSMLDTRERLSAFLLICVALQINLQTISQFFTKSK